MCLRAVKYPKCTIVNLYTTYFLEWKYKNDIFK